VLLDGVKHEFGVHSVLNHASLIFGATLQWGFVDLGLPLFPRHLEEARPKGGCERDDSARVVHIFVNQLVIETGTMAGGRQLRHQRWIRKRVVDVIEDQR
jgi:hypothetical protein